MDKKNGQEQHLARLHEEARDPGLRAFPEGGVLIQAAALVGDEVQEVGQGEAAPTMEQGHGTSPPAHWRSGLGLGWPGAGAWAWSPLVSPVTHMAFLPGII